MSEKRHLGEQIRITKIAGEPGKGFLLFIKTGSTEGLTPHAFFDDSSDGRAPIWHPLFDKLFPHVRLEVAVMLFCKRRRLYLAEPNWNIT
jgi:hypothetical protein